MPPRRLGRSASVPRALKLTRPTSSAWLPADASERRTSATARIRIDSLRSRPATVTPPSAIPTIMPAVDVYFSADVETDGPIPGPYSMLSFALVQAGRFDG